MTVLSTFRLVLDSYAMLAYYRTEPAAVAVRELLRSAGAGQISLSIAVVNLGEVVYRTIREFGEQRALEVLGDFERYPISVIDVDRQLALAAADLKGVHPISYADCIAAALAEQLGATLVTGDPDFHRLEDRIAIEWLPTT